MTAGAHMRQAPAGRSIRPDVEQTNRISLFPSMIHTVLVCFAEKGGGGGGGYRLRRVLREEGVSWYADFGIRFLSYEL